MKDSQKNHNSNRLILTSAFYHPEKTLRAKLRQMIDEWIDELEPAYDESDIRSLIAEEQGTPLEPFVLSEADLDMAVVLARAAFSKRLRQTRFRIVSSDTIGFKGGLVITNNLNHYYAERYVFGKYRRNPTAGVSFFPGYVPKSKKHSLFKLNKAYAKAFTDDEGFNIVVPWPYLGEDPGIVARDMQRYSRIGGVEDTFDRIGLRVEAGADSIEVRTGSPEAQIKMLAYMMNNETLRLSSSDRFQHMPEAQIVLEMPDEEENDISLKTAFLVSNETCDWLNSDFSHPIMIEKEEKVAISKWLPPHYSWIADIWGDLE